MKQTRHVHALNDNYDDALAQLNADVAELEARGWQKEGGISIVGYPLVTHSTYGYSISQAMVRGRDSMRLLLFELALASLAPGSAGAQTSVVKQALTDLSVLDFIVVYGRILAAGYGDEISRWFRILSAIEVGDPTAEQVRAMDTPHFSAGVMLRERDIDYITLSEFADILQKEQEHDGGQPLEETASEAQGGPA